MFISQINHNFHPAFSGGLHVLADPGKKNPNSPDFKPPPKTKDKKPKAETTQFSALA